MQYLKQNSYKGTNILLGNEKRQYINQCIELLDQDFEEIQIPIIHYEHLFANKVGEENNNMMFKLQDLANRELVLAPEYTAVIQELSQNLFKYERTKKLFYVQQCFRGERPQRGRWREFTQLGVEIINIREKDYDKCLVMLEILSYQMIRVLLSNYDLEFNSDVKRGLDYYQDGVGWEIRSTSGLQLCGGGVYNGADNYKSCGFAIGVDRVLLEASL